MAGRCIESNIVLLDGELVTPEQILRIGQHPELSVDLDPEAWQRVAESRAVVDRVLARNEVAYGINTGFGNFANVIIPNAELANLQTNLIRSHAAGVGEPLLPSQTRMLLALRINVFAKGHSGIRTQTVRHLLDALNKNCLSRIPSKGTVGASGDLAPLAHLALGMMGEGEMWDPTDKMFAPAASVLAKHGLTPIELKAKEGLALINGTQFITSIGAEAVVRAKNIARQADVIAALTLESLHGSVKPFHPAIHNARPHKGQNLVASRLRTLLNFGKTPSEIMGSHKNCGKVQDSYTMRCVPQIHGITHDTIDFVYGILSVECNSGTDNPMIFSKLHSHSRGAHPLDDTEVAKRGAAAASALALSVLAGNHHSDPCCAVQCASPIADPNSDATYLSDVEPHSHTTDHTHDAHSHDTHSHDVNTHSEHKHDDNHPHSHDHHTHADDNHSHAHTANEHHEHSSADDDYDMGVIMSGGNFHGEYPAKALDYLAIAVHELASVSERRIERLVNPHLSGLPAFLVKEGGLNSGFMISHCTAASLVSENKVLCHPSSVDSLSTSAAQEDHVSMGGMSARKALVVVTNVEYVLAIELLSAVQALEFSAPLTTTPALERVHALVRSVVRPWDGDRYMAPDIDACAQLLRDNRVWEAVAEWFPEQNL